MFGIVLCSLAGMACKKVENLAPDAQKESAVSNNNDVANNTPTENTKVNELNPDIDVYVGGYFFNGNYTQAAYWKNGALYPVEPSNLASVAYDVTVDQGDVYLIGTTTGLVPSYWKNGKHQKLTETGWRGWPFSITVKDGNAFIVGKIQESYNSPFYPVLWIIDQNNLIQEIYLEDQNPIGVNALKVFLDGDIVYIGGSNDNKACVWIYNNGLVSRLDKGVNNGMITDIANYGGNMYLFGYNALGGPQNLNYGYWMNDNNFISLAITGTMASISTYKHGFDLQGKIYSVGTTSNAGSYAKWAAIWNSEGSMSQQLSQSESSAEDIELDGNDSYVAGHENGKACIWVNGNIINFTEPYSQGRGIFLYQNK